MRLRNLVSWLVMSFCATLVAACSTDDATSAVVGAAAAATSPPETSTAGLNVRHGFIWDEAKGLTVIAFPKNATSMDVTAMNERGEIVGYVTEGEGTERYRAFIWSAADGLRKLGSLAGPDGISIALSIDDNAKVRGVSEGPSTVYNGPMGIYFPDGFEWTASSGMSRVTGADATDAFSSVNAGGRLILPPGTDCLEVHGASKNGQAIGYAGTWVNVVSRLSRDGPHCALKSALLWRIDGTPVVIAECGPKPWCETTLADVNNRGTVVGASASGAFRWTSAGGFEQIPIPETGVYFINEAGDAVGMVGTGGTGKPIVWKASGEIKTIRLPAGATYGYPVAINEKGEVAGSFQ